MFMPICMSNTFSLCFLIHLVYVLSNTISLCLCLYVYLIHLVSECLHNSLLAFDTSIYIDVDRYLVHLVTQIIDMYLLHLVSECLHNSLLALCDTSEPEALCLFAQSCILCMLHNVYATLYIFCVCYTIYIVYVTHCVCYTMYIVYVAHSVYIVYVTHCRLRVEGLGQQKEAAFGHTQTSTLRKPLGFRV